MILDEAIVIEHGVAQVTDLAGDADALGPRVHAGKGHALRHLIAFDAVQPFEIIEMPPAAAEFAIGDRLQADLFLFGDDLEDFRILDLA